MDAKREPVRPDSCVLEKVVVADGLRGQDPEVSEEVVVAVGAAEEKRTEAE